MNSMLKYKYYDTPEGQDIFLKTLSLSKYAAFVGFVGASYDVMMFSHPKGIVNTIGRYGWYIGPMVGIAAAFTVTTNAAQNIRGKNDKVNYFLGGAVAGSIVSVWARAPIIAVPAALILGGVAVTKKLSIDEGWEFFPPIVQATKTIKSVKHDWTMAKDIEELKNFTTGSN